MAVMASTDSVTRVTAIVALGLSAASIAWQLATFFLSGPRVRVRLWEGFRNPATGGVMLGALSNYSDGGKAIRAMGFTDHVVGAMARNSSRLPTTVTGWSIRFAGGVGVYMRPGDMLNPKLPYRLEAKESQGWFADVSDIGPWMVKLAAVGKREGSRGVIDLGPGKSIQSRDAVHVVNGAVVIRRPLLLRTLFGIRRFARRARERTRAGISGFSALIRGRRERLLALVRGRR